MPTIIVIASSTRNLILRRKTRGIF